MSCVEWKMPDEQQCRELDLPHTLVCKRGWIISSKIGISEREFDSVYSKIILRKRIGGRWRYSTAAVIEVFKGKQ